MAVGRGEACVVLDHWVLKLRHDTDATSIYVFANNHFEGMGVRAAQLELFDRTGKARMIL
jgi:hypothetical protein